MSDVEVIRVRNLLPFFQFGFQMCFVVLFIVYNIRDNEWKPLHIVGASLVVGDHDKGVVDVLVDPVPDILGVGEGSIVNKLKHHVLGAFNRLELFGESLHGNDILILIGEVHCEVCVDEIGPSCVCVSVIVQAGNRRTDQEQPRKMSRSLEDPRLSAITLVTREETRRVNV
jgi:hypothetical protein